MTLDCLVVVDRGPEREAVAEILHGHTRVTSVRFAGTAADARQLLGQRRFGLVLLILPLAAHDGAALLARITGRSPGSFVAVILPRGEEGLAATVRRRGAAEVLTYPPGHDPAALVRHLRIPLEGVLAAVSIHQAERTVPTAGPSTTGREPSAATGHRRASSPTAPSAPAPPAARRPRRFRLTAIASSTGGPDALARLLGELPASYPQPIVVVQHMPPEFTPILAESLDGKCALHVRQASHGAPLRAGTVYIAPGGRHLVLSAAGDDLVAELDDSPPECNVRPSANVLFRSLAGLDDTGEGILAVVLTGMGDDGCAGLQVLKQSLPCHCLAQDEGSCVVYGMPRAVVEAGLADEVLPLDRLPERIAALAGHREVPA